MNKLAEGYASAKAGNPRPSQKSDPKFIEGWEIYHDSKYWEQLAADLGWVLVGFSFRYSATMRSKTGESIEITPVLRDKLVELIDQRAM